MKFFGPDSDGGRLIPLTLFALLVLLHPTASAPVGNPSKNSNGEREISDWSTDQTTEAISHTGNHNDTSTDLDSEDASPSRPANSPHGQSVELQLHSDTDTGSGETEMDFRAGRAIHHHHSGSRNRFRSSNGATKQTSKSSPRKPFIHYHYYGPNNPWRRRPSISSGSGRSNSIFSTSTSSSSSQHPNGLTILFSVWAILFFISFCCWGGLGLVRYSRRVRVTSTSEGTDMEMGVLASATPSPGTSPG